MKIDLMKNVPRSRLEFERHANILRESLRDKRLQFAPHLRGAMMSVNRVRNLPNGRLDLLSIDESARNQMNTLAHMMATFGRTGVDPDESEPDDVG